MRHCEAMTCMPLKACTLGVKHNARHGLPRPCQCTCTTDGFFTANDTKGYLHPIKPRASSFSPCPEQESHTRCFLCMVMRVCSFAETDLFPEYHAMPSERLQEFGNKREPMYYTSV